jgi:5S rRNA maturation endonuclease (ribonuclease M5)
MGQTQKELFLFLKELKEASLNKPVIVEGKRDREFLNRFGVKNVLTISGKRYTDLLGEIPPETEEVVLLVDVDAQGEKIFRKLKGLFQRFNLKVDASFREKLKEFGVEEVEHLGKVFELKP